VRGQGINPRASWVAQSKQLGDLVEGLAGRIIERGADVAVSKVPVFVLFEIAAYQV